MAEVRLKLKCAKVEQYEERIEDEINRVLEEKDAEKIESFQVLNIKAVSGSGHHITGLLFYWSYW